MAQRLAHGGVRGQRRCERLRETAADVERIDVGQMLGAQWRDLAELGPGPDQRLQVFRVELEGFVPEDANAYRRRLDGGD
jgi:hypothetical protein